MVSVFSLHVSPEVAVIVRSITKHMMHIESYRILAISTKITKLNCSLVFGVDGRVVLKFQKSATSTAFFSVSLHSPVRRKDNGMFHNVIERDEISNLVIDQNKILFLYIYLYTLLWLCKEREHMYYLQLLRLLPLNENVVKLNGTQRMVVDDKTDGWHAGMKQTMKGEIANTPRNVLCQIMMGQEKHNAYLGIKSNAFEQ